MRILLLALPLYLSLAACSEAPPANKVDDAAPPAALSAGQWEISREVLKMTALDDGAPAIKVKAGDTTTSAVCVAPGETKRPKPEFVGGGGADGCTYDSLYLSNGRINAALSCNPAGMRGKLFVSSSGTFAAETMDLTLSSSTQLAGTGDVRIDEKITARRTGPTCTATPA